ncbi:MAG: EpsG family protein [Oscillospiraceae bacterium]|nr:EpsG family protein [Oscillospiraceae bacterium]
MLIYIILPVAAIVFGIFLCREKLKSAGKVIYCALAGAGLFAVAAMRFEVGYDYILYASWFNRLRLMSEDEIMLWSREKGFALPAKIMADVFSDFQVMFALIAFVITLGVMLLVYRRSAAPWVSVTAFLVFGLFFNSLNFMRQFIAAVFIAFALFYVAKNRFFRFAGFVLLASAFHFSALLLLPFYFIFKIKMNYISLTVMLTGSAVVYMFVTPLMDIAINYVYTAYDPVTNVEAASGLAPVYTVAFAVFFVLAFLLRKMLTARNPHANVLIMAMYFTVFFSLLGTAHGILSRLALLFAVAPVLILSADIYMVLRGLICLTFKDSESTKRTKARICAAFIVSLLFLVPGGFYYNFLLTDGEEGYNGVVPYRSIHEREREVL